MAKSSFPMPSGGGGLGKAVGFLVLAVCVIALVNDPVGAAGTVREVFDAVVSFVTTVAG